MLWHLQMVPTTNHSPPIANLSYSTTQSTTIQENIQFLHTACFRPTTSMLLQAIPNNQLITWPGFTTTSVQKYLPHSTATAKGYLDQQCKNQCSTKNAGETPIKLTMKCMNHFYTTCLPQPASFILT